MSMLSIEAKFYYQPLFSPKTALDRIVSGVEAIGAFAGLPLNPAPGDAAKLESGNPEVLESGLTYEHPRLGTFGDQASPWTMKFHHHAYDRLNLSVITTFAAIEPRDERGLKVAWDFCLHAWPRFVAGTDCRLALGNGDDDGLPRSRDLCPGELPTFFTPWVFVGPDRLDEERRGRLAEIPAYATREFEGGWIVQAVPNLYAPIHPELREALRTIPNWKPIDYRQGTPPPRGRPDPPDNVWFGSAG